MDKKPVKKKAFHKTAGETDIYVIRKQRLKIYIRRIQKLFEKKFPKKKMLIKILFSLKKLKKKIYSN